MNKRLLARAKEIMEANCADVASALEYERNLNGHTPIGSPSYVAVARHLEINWDQAVLMAMSDLAQERKVTHA